MTTRHYPQLDGLRGVAAAAVALGHAASNLGSPITFQNTALAVDLFFMLSGFVLVHAYGEAIRIDGSFARYIKARLVRLYPLVILGTALGIFAAIAQHGIRGVTVKAAFLSVALIPSIGAVAFPFNPPLWSLSFEMVASVLFGLGLWNTKNIKLLSVLSIAFGALLIGGLFHRGSIDAGWSVSSMHYGALRTIFGFTVGVLLYRVHLDRPARAHTPYWFLAIFLTMILVSPESLVLQALSIAIIFPTMIFLATSSNSLESRLTKWSGMLSYPIYAIHYPIIILLKLSLPKPYGLMIFAPVTVIISYMVLRLYDEPVRRTLRNWAKR